MIKKRSLKKGFLIGIFKMTTWPLLGKVHQIVVPICMLGSALATRVNSLTLSTCGDIERLHVSTIFIFFPEFPRFSRFHAILGFSGPDKLLLLRLACYCSTASALNGCKTSNSQGCWWQTHAAWAWCQGRAVILGFWKRNFLLCCKSFCFLVIECHEPNVEEVLQCRQTWWWRS